MSNQRLGSGRYVAPAAVPVYTETTIHQLQTADGASVAGVLHTVPGASTVAFLMHPRQDFTHHILVPELLSHGFAVWTQSTRGGLNDVSLIHEQAIIDMAAGHVFVRRQGFDAVVSVGHSGGGALAAYYMQQAGRAPQDRYRDTPGGRPIDLETVLMPEPDGLMMLAPHPGQGRLLMKMIDPAVTDENDPTSVDRSLDLYSAENGFAVPPDSSTYTSEFLVRYRDAQRARVERIDAVARQRLAVSKEQKEMFAKTGDVAARRRSLATGVIVVHRTDADPRCVDLAMDSNDRPYGSLFGHRPDLTNNGVVGFGRVTTPEAWLSTWSGLSSRASLAQCAKEVRRPVLLIELTGDQACFPTDIEEIVASFASQDVTHERIAGRHFGAPLHKGGPSVSIAAGNRMARWLRSRFPDRFEDQTQILA